ncbi:MAG: hypothetical protein M3041_14500 [Acidobacteriota bacterium]|nr:hypothetical protein [Acidobacteriota bacterium]
MRRRIPALFLALALACKAKESSAPPPPQPATPTASTDSGTTATVAQSATAPEVSPAGDIPDTQAFVKYRNAAAGYELDVPEGWARTENGANVDFVNKLDGVKVTVAPASAAPTAASVRANEARQIQGTITNISEVTLSGGKAVLIKYTSSSQPNAVTNKQVRLENEAYIFFKNGKTATLTLWAPQGADNVDQWQRMSKSFRWL